MNALLPNFIIGKYDNVIQYKVIVYSLEGNIELAWDYLFIYIFFWYLS